MVLRETKALELGCIAMAQGGNLVSALVSTQQYSRQKCNKIAMKFSAYLN
jgi:hypothetical protein